jgi:hypothetical protein
MTKTPARFSDADLESRRPVWEALSELFLDTSFDEADFNRIARVLARSPYSLEELEHILVSEVHPACGANMLSLAGEWTGFDPEWLESRIVRGPSRLGRLWMRTVGRITLVVSHEPWKEIRQRVEATRAAAQSRSIPQPSDNAS